MVGGSTILLAGDFHRLPILSIFFRWVYGLFSRGQHTRESHDLDRVYASEPIFTTPAKAVVKTKHCAVFVAPRPLCSVPSQTAVRVHEVRLRTPEKIASLQSHLERGIFEQGRPSP